VLQPGFLTEGPKEGTITGGPNGSGKKRSKQRQSLGEHKGYNSGSEENSEAGKFTGISSPRDRVGQRHENQGGRLPGLPVTKKSKKTQA